MSSTFTPSSAVDLTKEREWPVSLGMLDWDNTSIVFTKRSLIEFLKYTGTTVDPNFTNMAKLPRYAKFGRLSDLPSSVQDTKVDKDNSLAGDSTSIDFIPSRSVKTVPGGPHTDIFGNEDEFDALSLAPPKNVETEAPSFASSQPPEIDQNSNTQDEVGINFSSSVIPSRRVRENPSGNTILANFWDAPEPTEFKPTRRVTQGPGGHDSVSDIF